MKSLFMIFLFLCIFGLLTLVLYNRELFVDKSPTNLRFQNEDILKFQASTPNRKIDSEAICKLKDEWEPIGNFLFAKKSALFYFPNSSHLTFIYIDHKRQKNNISISLTVIKNQQGYSYQITEGIKRNNLSTYALNTNMIHVHLPEYFFDKSINNTEFFNTNDIKLFVRINHINSGLSTNSPLAVRLKYKNQNVKKKSILICSKTYFGDAISPKSFESWFKYSKKTGIEKIVIGNHSLYSKTLHRYEEFNKIYNDYKDYVEIMPVDCIPIVYVINKYDKISRPKYILSHQMTNRSWFYDPLAPLAQNECLNEHRNDYDYVFVSDYDEYVFPKLISRTTNTEIVDYVTNMNLDNPIDDLLKMDCIKNEANENPLSRYIHELHDKLKYKLENSLLFNSVYFIKDDSVNKIMDTMDKLFKEKFVDDNLENIRNYKFKKNESLMIGWRNKYASYNFSINTTKELEYAINLNKIYKVLIKPMMQFIKLSRNNLTRYDRFFKVQTNYLGDPDAGSKKSFDRIDSHDSVIFHISPGPYFALPKDIAEYSHFRSDEYEFARIMPITDLMIDFNYMSCYYFDLNKDIIPDKDYLIEKVFKNGSTSQENFWFKKISF